MTLIEVLIASLILFMAIGLSASVFRQSALLQNKVLSLVDQSDIKKRLVPKIMFELEQDKTSGEVLEEALTFSWIAKLEKANSYVASYNPEGSSVIGTAGKIKVYQVTVKSSHWKNWSFEYEELLWRP